MQNRKDARPGFDWPTPDQVVDKLEEEIGELRRALESEGPDRVRAEIGDLLFTMANLARHLGVDPEAALAGTNAEFRRRFAHMEAALADRGSRMDEHSLAELEHLWRRAKGGD